MREVVSRHGPTPFGRDAMAGPVSRLYSAWEQVIKRSLAHWRLLSSVALGVVLASAIMAGTVIYFEALRELALKATLAKRPQTQMDILLEGERGPCDPAGVRQTGCRCHRRCGRACGLDGEGPGTCREDADHVRHASGRRRFGR